MSNFHSTIGQRVGGVALPPTRSDLADWKKNRWWWEQETPDRMVQYDEAARNPTPSTERPVRKPRERPNRDTTLT